MFDKRNISWKNRLLGFCLVILAVLSVIYLTRGFYFLVFEEGRGAADLWRRHVSQRYVLKGQNPYDVLFHESAIKQSLPTPEISRNAEIDSHLGVPEIGYPPWTFFSNYFLLGSDWPEVRIYYALWNILALILIGSWAALLGLPQGKRQALLMVLATTAIGNICTSLGNGQYGNIVIALLVGCLWLEAKNHTLLAGLLLGLALMKPSISAPFVIPFLIKKRFKLIAVALGYLMFASIAIWLQTKTQPFEMISQMFLRGEDYASLGYGPLPFLMQFGFDPKFAILVLAAGVSFCALILMRVLAAQSMLTHFAIASVAARFWTYHQLYDNVVLFFLLMALGHRRFSGNSFWSTIAFWLVGFSLWLPGRVMDLPFIQGFQMFVWLSGLIILVSSEWRREPRSFISI